MTSSGDTCATSESQPCRCERVQNVHGYFEDHVNCSREDLGNVPTTLPSNITVLDFSYNRILPNKLHALCKYVNLANVSLAYNFMNKIPNGELHSCHISDSLDLTGNVFISITSDSLLGLEDVRAIYGLEAHSFDSQTFSKLKNLEHMSMKTYQTTIPSQLFGSLKLKSLFLYVSGALEIPENIFQFGSATLTELHLDSSSLQRLPNDLLKGLTKVETVALRMNNIRDLPESLFQFEGENRVRSLHISGVQKLPSRLFMSLDRLTRLEIHRMKEVTLYLLRRLIKLEHLDLTKSNTEQGSILSYLLKGLWNLKTLILSNCDISSFEANSLESMRSLQSLDLSHNRIRFLTRKPFIHVQLSLKELTLKGNGISLIEPSVFQNLRFLELLDLSDNNIYKLDDIFEDLVNLQTLLLRGNKIVTFPGGVFEPLTALKQLDLADNVFEEDQGKVLTNSKNLSNLDLSDNHISTLSESLVNNLVGLAVLHMELNPLHCDCDLLRHRDVLIARGVQIMAWCFSPTYTHLDNAQTEECVDSTTQPVVLRSYLSSESMTYAKSIASNNDQNSDKSNSQVDVSSSDSDEQSSEMSVKSTTMHEYAGGSHSENGPIVTVQTHIPPRTKSPTIIVSSTVEMYNASSSNITRQVNPRKETSPYVIHVELTQKEKYYISVAFISSVSFVCVFILVCLGWRRWKSRSYEMADVFTREFDIEKLGDPSSARTERPRNKSITLGVLEEVPTISVETVDDDGNVNSMTYPASQVPEMRLSVLPASTVETSSH